MPSPEVHEGASVDTHPKPVASYAHTLGLLAIFAAAFAFLSATQGKANPVAIPDSVTARRIVPGLIESLLFDWLVLYYVWAGVKSKGVSLFALSGRGWRSVGDVMHDMAIAAPFWVLWEAAALMSNWLLNTINPQAATGGIGMFPVRGVFEISMWILVSITAGFCEELIFRGYLQRQFGSFTGSVWAGVLMQAVVFGLIHPRGWRAVLVISILGALYGALAVWRKNLRAGMIAHAWSDLWEGWLKFSLHLNL